jgi:hypothetical protein
MDWKLKAKLQNVISTLPANFSNSVYYWMQRNFGGLRKFSPVSRLAAGIETWKRIQSKGRSPFGKVFLEIGTGRVPLVPIAYFLMGAEKTISIDLNFYLKEELIAEQLIYMYENQEEILNLFGSLIVMKRFDSLLELVIKQKLSAEEVLNLCNIQYIAPGDAAKTNLPSQCIDFFTSYTVLEHISPEKILDIQREGNRLVKPNGLFVHFIDYSDYFSHSDKNICAINFLKYSNATWDRYANNRYMYMNRLRHDDFLNLFENTGNKIIEVSPNIDFQLKELLGKRSFKLDNKFSSKSIEILATTSAWISIEKDIRGS